MTDTKDPTKIKEIPALLLKDKSPTASSEAKESLIEAINESEAMRKRALQYSAHLSKLLNEACSILEDLTITIEVSEPLQCWWEREKRKKEAKNVGKAIRHPGGAVRDLSGLVTRDTGLVSASGTPILSEQETEPTSGKD